MLAYPHHDIPVKAKPHPAMIRIRLIEYNVLKEQNAALVEALEGAQELIQGTYLDDNEYNREAIDQIKAALETAKKVETND